MSTEPQSPAVRSKVLLVDDAPENLTILLEVLKDEYQVVAARSGLKALEMAHQSPRPDIILLDVVMPEMDGYEVCRRLKQDEATRDIPVIFITALAEDVNEEKGFDVGAVDYITKPISASIVRARVRTHLALKQAQQQLQQQNRALIEGAQLREDVERIMQHDLKGPLTTIIGMPTLLLNKENITDRQKETLNLIKDAGYLMLEMINSSLNLYKMESGSYNYNPQQVDLLQITQKVFAECQNLCAAHEVTLHLTRELELPQSEDTFPIMAEELLSHTMLSNLIKNAVEASPAGGTVAVNLSHQGGRPTIAIHNQGEIPQAIRERFFDKYVTAGKQQGTGLGTYSARLMAKTQGGEISFESSKDEGTTLRVVFGGNC
ncbi:MAG: hybrid sensor histidine kinase/response regulator [Chromatiales bacterium]|nr:hybrid sensor histidine kinase/response regulator [Chromatiales bacterium]